ncbi:hypothetical protein JG688_00016034 [Phytophthora aleatoria]|uniref:Uncharacterized protein n=1 Tax=Phytophthora aleatoria TaxID=2496075 RepID=A0A8J5ID46_9STRA|nr:hypothetical protein JG688_00016034 [Phytophthora aleatoria]
MNDLASVTQAMGTPKYKGMLQALTQFRDQAAQALVPQLGPHRKVTSAPTPDTAETTTEPEEDRCGGGLDGIGIEDIGDRIEAPTTNAVVSSGVDTVDSNGLNEGSSTKANTTW